MDIEKYVSHFTPSWIESFGNILHPEHLKTIETNLLEYQQGYKFDKPYFKDEIREDLSENFEDFLVILNNFKNKSDVEIAQILQQISFEKWLMILGQRLTSTSIRNEKAIPPIREVLLKSLSKPFNSEITVAQRAWEKHINRSENSFWGIQKGNNKDKSSKMLEKVFYIIKNQTWWNIFSHYKHSFVYEIRTEEGYGLRWKLENLDLIGFLEPFINE